jgi:hypothetical protein
MKLSALTISVLFTIGTILSSCCHILQCTNDTTILNHITFLNFTKSELDTVIVKRFVQQTNFASPMDIFILDSLNTSLVGSDSTSYSVTNFGNYRFNITVGYDYEILIPATNTLAKINNLLEPQTSIKVCDDIDGYNPTSCTNEYTSIYVNGQAQSNFQGITITK